MSEQQLLRVFLSYSPKDRQSVRNVYEQLLQTGGVEPWFDDKILLPGEEWENEISKAVQSSDMILVCVSRNIFTRVGSLDPDIIYALNQATKRIEDKPPIILIKLEPCDVPEPLQGFPTLQWFDSDGYEQLFGTLQNHAKSPLVAREEGARKRPTDRLITDARTKNDTGKLLLEDRRTRPDETGKLTRPADTGKLTRPTETSKLTRPTDTGKLAAYRATLEETAAQVGTTMQRPTSAQSDFHGQRWSSNSGITKYVGIGVVVMLILAVILIGQRFLSASPQPQTLPKQASAIVLSPGNGHTEENQGEVVAPLMMTPIVTSTSAISLTTTETPPHPALATILTPTTTLTQTAIPTATTILSATAIVPSTEELTQTTLLTPTTALTPSVVLTPSAVLNPPLPVTPTDTPVPTDTPIPTDTPAPTDTPTPPDVPTPVVEIPPQPTTYEIQAGDTMRSIAAQFNVSMQAILEANNMTPEQADTIHPGQKLVIPPPSPDNAPPE